MDLSHAAGHDFYDIMKNEMVVASEEPIVSRKVRRYVEGHGKDLITVHGWKNVYKQAERVPTRPQKERVWTKPAAKKPDWWK